MIDLIIAVEWSVGTINEIFIFIYGIIIKEPRDVVIQKKKREIWEKIVQLTKCKREYSQDIINW